MAQRVLRFSSRNPDELPGEKINHIVNMHNSGFLIHLINDCIPFPQDELVIFAIRDIIPLLTVQDLQLPAAAMAVYAFFSGETL